MQEVFRKHLARIIWSASLLLIFVAAVLIDATSPSQVEMIFSGMDKIVHFLVFGFIAYFCINLLHETGLVDALFLPLHSFVFVANIGVLSEVIQSYTPSRTAEVQDVMADLVGAIVFIILWYRIKKREKEGGYL